MWNTYIAAASRNVRLSAGIRGVSYVGGRGVRVRGRGIEGTDASRTVHRSRVHSFAEQGGESVDIPPGIVQF